ncbi:MAG: O-antigen ligase family protein [bacterium]
MIKEIPQKIIYLIHLKRISFIGIAMFALFSPISISLSQIGLGIAFLGWIIEKRRFQRTGLDIPILLFLLASFIGVITSFNFKRSIGGFREDLWVITYFLVAYILSYEDIKRVLFLLFFGSIISSGYGLFHYLKEPGRIGGLLGSCMTFANHQILVFLFFFPLFFYFFKQKPWWNKKCLFLGSGLIIIICAIILSLTRGAWIGLFCGMLFFFILTRNWKAGLLGTTLIIIFFLLFSPIEVINRTKSILDINSWKRLCLWKGGIELWKKSPIFGIGIDNYEFYIEPYINPDKLVDISTCHAHSNYIQILSERGIIGFIAFIFLFSIFKESFLIIKKKRGISLFLGYGLLSAFCGFLVSGISEYTFSDSEVVMLFWFLAGIGDVIRHNDK